jgi:hypothetical protein
MLKHRRFGFHSGFALRLACGKKRFKKGNIVMRCFLAADDVADGLLDLALEGREPPLPHLRARFDALDYDRATLPVDFDAALTALTRGLTDALLAAAMAPDSPLHHRPQGRELSGASTSAHHRPFKSSEPPSRGRRKVRTPVLRDEGSEPFQKLRRPPR